MFRRWKNWVPRKIFLMEGVLKRYVIQYPKKSENHCYQLYSSLDNRFKISKIRNFGQNTTLWDIHYFTMVEENFEIWPSGKPQIDSCLTCVHANIRQCKNTAFTPTYAVVDFSEVSRQYANTKHLLTPDISGVTHMDSILDPNRQTSVGVDLAGQWWRYSLVCTPKAYISLGA